MIMIVQFIEDIKKIFINPILIKESKKNKTILIYFFFAIIVLIAPKSLLPVARRLLNIAPPFQNIIVGKVTFFIVVIYTPMIEEFCFRAFLKKSKINMTFLLSGLTSLILVFTLKVGVFYHFIIFISIIIFTYLLLSYFKCYFKYFTRYQLSFMVYFSSISFGLAHLVNHEGITFYTFFPLLMLSIFKVLDGFLISMLRLKFGLLYSVIFHSTVNLIAFLLMQLSVN